MDSGLGDTPLAVVAAMRTQLRPAERRVADAVLADPAMVAREPISGLAARCGVSAATVVRFARRVGYRGYPQLRVALARAAGVDEGRSGRSEISGTLKDNDTLADVAAKVAFANARSIEDTIAALDLAALEKAVDSLATAGRIDVVGIGSSALSAADLVQKLCRFGRNAWAHQDRHGAATAIALRGAGDVVVGFSHSGATDDVLSALRLAANNSAVVVAVTANTASPMAELADVVLTYKSREPTYRLGAMASRIAQLAVVDCIFAGMASKQPEPVRAAIDRTFAAVADL